MGAIRQIDENGDWIFGNGRNSYLINENAVAQNLQSRILEYRNDWFANYNAGVDYDFLLTNKETQSELETSIRKIILETQDVQSIINFFAEKIERSLNIRVNVTTLYSQNLRIDLTI